jgi:hypothetical protein
MNRDGLGVPEPLSSTPDAHAKRLAARLHDVERDYRELRERVRRYERERIEIKRRLEQLLDRLGFRLEDG